MNILFINSARQWGGNEKWSLAAAAGLAGKGHRVFFGCRSPMFRERAQDAAIRFVWFPMANVTDALSVAMISLFIRRHEIDAVVPTKQRDYLLGGLAAFPFRRVKVIARLGIDRPLRTWRNRFAFTRLCDGVIVNAQSTVTTLGQTPGFDTSICRVIYNGIEVSEPKPGIRDSVRREFGIGSDHFLIGCAGRLTPQKGCDWAIEALADLARAAPQARLIIAGDGPYLDQYKKQAHALGVADKTVFAGYRNDMADVLQAIDLFWLTSRSEGMPNVLLEAMACAKASVAFDVAGVPEILENGREGYVVKLGDCVALAERTRHVITHPVERRQMELAAKKKVCETYRMKRMVDAIETYIAELIRR